jgi:hypothetical protein
MTSKIIELKANGEQEEKALYSLSPKKALIAYVMQNIKRNNNTWDYPEELEGIKESGTKSNVFYYDDGNVVIGSFLSITTRIVCKYENGNKVYTRFNGTIEDARKYFVGGIFNLGAVEDNLVKCIDVEELKV